MASTYKLLGKVSANGAIGTYSTLYTAAGQVVLSKVKAVNKNAASQTIRIAVGCTTTTPGAIDWDVYTYALGPNDTLEVCQGDCMDATDKYLMVSASSSDVNFKVYGAEIA